MKNACERRCFLLWRQRRAVDGCDAIFGSHNLANTNPRDLSRGTSRHTVPTGFGVSSNVLGSDHRHGFGRPLLGGARESRKGTEGRGEPGREDLSASALQQEVMELRRRVKKLTALLGSLSHCSKLGIHADAQRLPDGRAKMRILRAVDYAREFVPLRTLLRFLRYPAPLANRLQRSPPVASSLSQAGSRPIREVLPALRVEVGGVSGTSFATTSSVRREAESTLGRSGLSRIWKRSAAFAQRLPRSISRFVWADKAVGS